MLLGLLERSRPPLMDIQWLVRDSQESLGHRRLCVVHWWNRRRDSTDGTRATTAEFALAFQSPEYLMLMILGLSLVFAFAEEGDHLKALAMVLLVLALLRWDRSGFWIAQIYVWINGTHGWH